VLLPALLQELGTDVNLYALVFGESVLNDAVIFYNYNFSFLLVKVNQL